MVDYESTDVAHRLLCRGSREEIIYWCAWNDHNGIFRDEDCRLEGLPVLDERAARLTLLQFLLVPSYQDGHGKWRDGSRVRVYGLSGTFVVRPYDVASMKDTSVLMVPVAKTAEGGRQLNVRVTEIVEIDGDPVALRESPRSVAAADYPHTLQTDYGETHAPF